MGVAPSTDADVDQVVAQQTERIAKLFEPKTSLKEFRDAANAVYPTLIEMDVDRRNLEEAILTNLTNLRTFELRYAYVTKVFTILKEICDKNTLYQPFALNVEATAELHRFVNVILSRYIWYNKAYETVTALNEAQTQFTQAAKDNFSNTSSQMFNALKQVAVLSPISEEFTMDTKTMERFFAKSPRGLKLPKPQPLKLLPAEQFILFDMNYKISHWQQLTNLNGFLTDQPHEFFQHLKQLQSNAVAADTALRAKIHQHLLREQAIRVNFANQLMPFRRRVSGDPPSTLIIIAASHGEYKIINKDTRKRSVEKATVPLNMTLTKVPVIYPGIVSVQDTNKRDQLVVNMKQLKPQVDASSGNLKDVLEIVVAGTQNFATQVILDSDVDRRFSFDVSTAMQFKSETIVPITYLPCQKYLNKTFERGDHEHLLMTMYDLNTPGQNLMYTAGHQENTSQVLQLNTLMTYAQSLRVQHVILVDLTCAVFKTSDVLSPVEHKKLVQRQLERTRLGGGR